MPVSFETPDRGELFQTYLSRLQQLRDGLPDRFHALLDTLMTHLPRLFDQTWPLVPNHTDLLENNIHVDSGTGDIMGICDWRDAEVSPFGMSLGGLETMLGVRAMNENGWTYRPKRDASILNILTYLHPTACHLFASANQAYGEMIRVARTTT